MKRLILIIFVIGALAGCGGSNAGKLVEEGKKHFADKNYNGAIVVYKSVLDKSPENLDARLGLARSYLMAEKYESAQKNFDKYLLQNPYDNTVYLDLGKIAFHNKNFIKALELLRKYNEAYPESVEGNILMGQAFFFSRNNGAAMDYFNKALNLDPENIRAMLGKARVLLSNAKTADAEVLVDKILAKDQINHEGLYLKAKCVVERGDTEAYKDIFLKIHENHPNDAYAAYVVGKRLVKEGKFDKAWSLANSLDKIAPETGFGRKLVGLSLYTQKKYDAAVNAYMEAVSVRPDPEGYYMLGICNYENGNYETAISHLRKAVDYSPGFSRARELISQILLHQQRYDESVAEARKIIEEDSDNLFARMTLGDAYFSKGESSKAIAEYEKATKVDPEVAQSYFKMGAVHYSMGELGKTESALKDAISASPENVRPKVVLAAFYLRNAENAKAREVLASGLDGSPEDALLYTLLARMDLIENKYDKAKNYLNKAIEADPKGVTPYMMLATMNLAEKKTDEALVMYNRALEQNPDFLRGLLGKAQILNMLDRKDEAEACYLKALESEAPEAFIRYAVSKARNGENDRALEILAQGRKLNPMSLRLAQTRASVLFEMKRFQEVLQLCNEMEKIEQGAALGLRIRTHMIMGDSDKAIRSARQIVDFFPKQPVGYLTLYRIYSSIGDSERAYGILKEAQQKCGPKSVIMTTFSGYYSSRGEYKKALNFVDAAIKRNEQDHAAHTIKGNILLQMGYEKKAADSFSKALQYSDRYVPALNNLAMLYVEDPETSLEAMRLAYTAYLQEPLEPTVLDTFGYTLIKNDRAKEAVPVLEKALSINGDDPSIGYHLGLAYLDSGRSEEALVYFKKVAECVSCQESGEAVKLISRINKDSSKQGGKE